MEKPPPENPPAKDTPRKQPNKIFVAGMGVIGLLVAVLVVVIYSHRPDAGQADVRFSRIDDHEDALFMLTIWSERTGEKNSGDDGLVYYFARLKIGNDVVPPNSDVGLHPLQQGSQEFHYNVPNRFESNELMEYVRVNLRLWRFFLGRIAVRFDASPAQYNMIQPDGSTAPLTAPMADLAKEVVKARPRHYSPEEGGPHSPEVKKTPEELTADKKREHDFLRQLNVVDPSASGAAH